MGERSKHFVSAQRAGTMDSMVVSPGEALYLRHAARAIPLVRSETARADDISMVKQDTPEHLFPKARDAASALSGLFLLLGDWKASHDTAQNLSSREGSYWHAIVHRMEPDARNSRYWYRRVGAHPLYQPLFEEARDILSTNPVPGWALGSAWEPTRFVDWCEDARLRPGSRQEGTALAIQRSEFHLLYHWCASQRNPHE